MLLLDPSAFAAAKLDAQLSISLVPERETWGSSPDAVARYRAAERQAGGPAPMRSKG